MKLFLIFLGLLILVLPLEAQEEPLLDWDIDSVFDAPAEEAPIGDKKEDPPEVSGASLVRQRGITFETTFEFLGGFAPGWEEAPWFSGQDGKFAWSPSAKMTSNFSLDARISEVFRVNAVVYFEIPNFAFQLRTFFADYSLYDVIFFRAGKYEQTWGISPNFKFTDLLSRVPANRYAGDSFILKADIPVGIGGFQFLALTRADLMNGAEPDRKDLGYGGKFNLALRLADFDLGVFYQDGMALRSFLSVKTTIGNTELYNEWLGVLDTERQGDLSGAVNLGFIHTFFSDKLRVNGEVYYNAEKNAYWYQPETSIKDAEVSPLVDGWNLALNLLYRFGGKGDLRFFVIALYAPGQDSARLVPGIRLAPFPHTELFFAVPMALGSRDGYYYNNTPDLKNRPFSVMVLLTLKGSARVGY